MRYTNEPRIPIKQIQAWRNSYTASNSTLIVPKIMSDYLGMKRRQHGGLRNYFNYLIMVYGVHLDFYQAEPQTNKCKKKYQSSGQDMQRFDFRPNSAGWEQMRNLSFMYGPSICWMFVYLMKLEQQRWMAAGCPENFFEEPPERLSNHSNKRNSEEKKKEALNIIKNTLLNSAPRTILLRIMDDKHLILTRTGQIRL